MVQSLYIFPSVSSVRRDRSCPAEAVAWECASFIYILQTVSVTGWDKCWTFLLLLAVTGSLWQMTPHPPAQNVCGGARGWAIASVATRPLVPPLTCVAVAVTWAWPWPSWGRDWRVLCRAGGRGRWPFRGAAAGKPGAPRCGACTGPTALGFGWSAARRQRHKSEEIQISGFQSEKTSGASCVFLRRGQNEPGLVFSRRPRTASLPWYR